MTDHPILFSGEMVRAILAGRKTQTRRIINPQPASWASVFQPAPVETPGGSYGKQGQWVQSSADGHHMHGMRRFPYGQVGDRLWVKETWQAIKQDTNGISYTLADPADETAEIRYRATDETFVPPLPWRPSIYMRRRMSRITLEVTEIRVERLQDISEEDAIAEGIENIARNQTMPPWPDYRNAPDQWHEIPGFDRPVHSYRSLWESINGPGSWDANPWVWVVGFKMLIPV
jgi:hypothetical protein